MIKAVIFDCFGVLTTDGWKQIREEYFSGDEKLLQRSMDMDKAVNAGMMDYGDFLQEISDMSGLSVDQVRDRMNGSSPNSILFNFIRDELAARVKIGMLSNAAANWLDELFDPWQVKIFDEVVLSYETRTVKPDPLMYQTIVGRLDIDPSAAIYVDDSERYVMAAEDLGMLGVYHTDTNQTIVRIRELLNA